MNLTNTFILVLSVLPPIYLGGATYLFYKRERILEFIIFLATVIHETILISLPCIMDVLNNYKLEKDLRFPFDPYDLLRVIIIENIYILIFLLPFIFLVKKPGFHFKTNPDKLYNFFALITCIGIIVGTYQILHRPTLEEIVDSYSQSGLTGSSNKFIAFFNITFDQTSIIAATILSVRAKSETYPKIYQYLGILMLMLILTLVATSGVRGRVVWVAEFVFLVAIFKKKYKPILYMLILALIFIPINNVLVTQIRPISEEIAKEGGITNQSLINISTVIIKGISQPNKDSPGLIESLDERAQGPRNSAVLLKEYDAGRSPGLNIYTGALFYFFPRFVINRPVIGSPDEYFQHAAIFKVMALNYANDTFINMGPMLASAHAYWEGGYIGVIIIAMLCSFFWISLITISYRLPMLLGLTICLMVCCALLIDGFISIFTPLYALISIVWKSILPLLLLYFIYYKVKVLKFK
jgi:hypothetical protein